MPNDNLMNLQYLTKESIWNDDIGLQYEIKKVMSFLKPADQLQNCEESTKMLGGEKRISDSNIYPYTIKIFSIYACYKETLYFILILFSTC